MSELFSWHRAAIAGINPPVHEGDPQMGWYKSRLVRGGPFVTARIWIKREICMVTGKLETPEEFTCTVNGQIRDPYREWVWLANNPITKEAYTELSMLHDQVPAMKATRVSINLSEKAMRP